MGFFSRGHCGTWAFVKLTNPHATERTKCRGWGSGRRFCEVEQVGFLFLNRSRTSACFSQAFYSDIFCV